MNDKNYLLTNGIVSVLIILFLVMLSGFCSYTIDTINKIVFPDGTPTDYFDYIKIWINPPAPPENTNNTMIVVGLLFEMFDVIIGAGLIVCIIVFLSVVFTKNIDYNKFLLIACCFMTFMMIGSIAQLSQWWYSAAFKYTIVKFVLVLFSIITGWGLYFTNKFVFKS